MSRKSRPGVGESFQEYYENTDPVISGDIESFEYRIYRIRDTHYSLYAKFPDVCICMIENRLLPRVPVRDSINFGPTDEGWIGFTTNGVTEYNYNNNLDPLPDDRREEPTEFKYFDKEDICRWTPRLLESSLTDWIKKVEKELEDAEMQCSH